MNTQYAGKIKRPNGVPDTDPVPIPVTNPLPLNLRVKWLVGGSYTNLAVAKKWVTIKSDLEMTDVQAEVYLVSGEAGDPFTVINGAKGDLKCVIPGSEMETLVVDTMYYIDVQILEDSEPYTVLYDTLRPYQPVTKTTS